MHLYWFCVLCGEYMSMCGATRLHAFNTKCLCLRTCSNDLHLSFCFSSFVFCSHFIFSAVAIVLPFCLSFYRCSFISLLLLPLRFRSPFIFKSFLLFLVSFVSIEFKCLLFKSNGSVFLCKQIVGD